MSETETSEPDVPGVTDVPEPDQEPHEPIPDEADEQGEGDADEAGELEPEPEPTPEARGATQAEWEKRFKDAEKRFETYKRAIFGIFGDDAHDLLPVSISPSAPPGFIYRHDAGRVPDEVQAPILEFFGLAREREYKRDPETETCQACDGEGKTQTGSKVPNHQTRPCPRCLGWGYTKQGRAPSETPIPKNGELADAAEQVGPLVTDDRDAWGEPKILPDGRVNPNYGKMPQFKEQIEPWGQTAGLGAQDAVVGA